MFCGFSSFSHSLTVTWAINASERLVTSPGGGRALSHTGLVTDGELNFLISGKGQRNQMVKVPVTTRTTTTGKKGCRRRLSNAKANGTQVQETACVQSMSQTERVRVPAGGESVVGTGVEDYMARRATFPAQERNMMHAMMSRIKTAII